MGERGWAGVVTVIIAESAETGDFTFLLGFAVLAVVATVTVAVAVVVAVGRGVRALHRLYRERRHGGARGAVVVFAVVVAFAVAVMVAVSAFVSVASLPPCATEDSTACYWNAETMGNGRGDSFIADGGA